MKIQILNKTRLIWVLLVIAATPYISIAATLTLDNSSQTYSSLSNTTVTMTGRSELHMTGTGMVLSGCQIHLNSPDAWLFLTQIKPSAANTSTYLNQIKVNGSSAVLNSNIRITAYVNGTVVIPHGSTFQPLEVFNGMAFTGTSMKLGLYTYYRDSQLGAMNNAIRSFRLKRGYMATFARESDGTGSSKVYIADRSDLTIGVLPPDLYGSVSFVRVFPWRWATQKGWAGGSISDADLLNCSWRYDWDNAATSTLNVEYVPMRHNANWNSYSNINNKQGSTHALGFNEPDKSDQANMTVAQAIAQWPNLLASGLRLGSPAPSDAASGLGWLYEFIDEADARNYRVDYVVVHFYKNNWTASQLENWLWGIHQRTGRPIWITEFNNGCNWTTPHPTYEQNAAKINELITRMAGLPYVERYSIYQWCTNREMISNGSPTPAGIVYRDHVSPPAIALDPNRECIGYWRLDDPVGTTALDLSGRYHHGALKNGLAFGTHSVAGTLGSGLRFDGTDDYIELPAGFDEFDNGFTITLWARPTAVKSWARFLDMGIGANNQNIYLARRSTSNDLIFSVYDANWNYLTAANAIDTNQWQFFAATVNASGTAVLYKNGQPIASGGLPRPANVRRTTNYLGRSNWSADGYYQGDMDDVRMFDYALTAGDIAALYALSVPAGPYGGSAATIPGRVEAEAFDLGGQGVSYLDTSFGNTFGQFRPDEDVDIRSLGGSAYAVTNITANEWLNYTVNIAESGTYCLYLQASAAGNNIPVTVTLNGSAVGTIIVNSTGSTDTFQAAVLNNISLPAGSNQTLRLAFDGAMDVDWIQFDRQGPWNEQALTLPGKVEVEEFDSGGPGVAYYDTTAGNAGGQFRLNEHVDIAAISDSGAGYAVDGIAEGEWLLYTVNTAAAQTDVYARVASIQGGGQIRVWLDGDLLATIDVPNTGDLTVWQTVSATCAPLPERENGALKLEFVGTGFRVNWLQFGAQTPYTGIPTVIPGRLEFENFDLGGQHISYLNNTAVNGYGQYRPLDAVDIMAISDGGPGFAVFASAGEWLEYTCTIQAGVYSLVVRSTSPYLTQPWQLLRGNQPLAAFSLPTTGGWSNWQDTVVEGVELPGGEQTLRFKVAQSSGLINRVDFIRQYSSADLTRDGLVDLDDLMVLAGQWMGIPGTPSADVAPFGGDGIVNLTDLQVLAEHWMRPE